MLTCAGREATRIEAAHDGYAGRYGLTHRRVLTLSGDGTDLAGEDDWQDPRVVVCPEAGFLCEPVDMANLRTWKMQYKRLINYSVRHFQNIIITSIMRGRGPQALPPRLAVMYGEWLPQFRARPGLMNRWFDRRALQRMAKTLRG